MYVFRMAIPAIIVVIVSRVFMVHGSNFLQVAPRHGGYMQKNQRCGFPHHNTSRSSFHSRDDLHDPRCFHRELQNTPESPEALSIFSRKQLIQGRASLCQNDIEVSIDFGAVCDILSQA